MKKSVFVFAIAAFLVSCSEAEDKLCDCIKVGDDLNKKTHEILQGSPNGEIGDRTESFTQKTEKCV